MAYYGVRRGEYICHQHTTVAGARKCATAEELVISPRRRYDLAILADGTQQIVNDRREPAEILAARAGYRSDEHGGYGSSAGDYWTVVPLDFVPPEVAAEAPYFDGGGEGLALVRVDRERRHSKSYMAHHYPSRASSTYLVGRNEAGTYFAHPVPATRVTVEGAIRWIWAGHADQIVARQGDVAVVRSAGPKIPRLPSRHVVEAGYLVHPTHDPISLPGVGERIIVARRAVARVSPGTKD